MVPWNDSSVTWALPVPRVKLKPLPFPGPAQRNRKFRLELAVESGDRHAGVGPLGHGQTDITVVGGEGVAPTVPDWARYR